MGCIVVTGASGNLGQAVCARLLRDGASVFGLVHGERGLKEIETHPAELTDEASVEAAYGAARRRFGEISGSVHTAGGWEGGTVAATSLATFEKMIASEVAAPVPPSHPPAVW